MRTKALLILSFLVLTGSFCPGNDDVPVAISPGSNAGVAAVESRCPTFSWGGVAWAQKYRVVVFGVEGERTRNGGEAALTPQPVLSEDIAGGGFSWTPSVSQGLAAGADYAWCVGALDSDGAWAWSATRRFRVEQSTRSALSEEDTAGMKGEKAAANAAAGPSEETTAGQKDSGTDLARPMSTEGTNSTFFGTNAGANNSSDGNANSFFGSNAGFNNTTATGNSFMGWKAGYSNSGNSNIFIGSSTGYNNSGTGNTFIGMGIGYNNTGSNNAVVGSNIGSSNSGDDNVFMGDNAGFSNTSGYDNTFLGFHAGMQNTTGDNNTYLGWNTGAQNSTGSRNVFLGNQAGEYEYGSDKLYIDNSTTSSPLIYGDFSTNKVGINGWLGVGTETPAYPIELETTGLNAAFVASRASGASNFMNATASYGQFGTVNNYPVRILVNATWRMTLNTDNSLTMASGATCTAGGKWTDASSRALKENIIDLKAEEALAALQGLNPVRFTYKADDSDEQVGFIAEDVPDLVATRDRKSMSAMDVVAVLTQVAKDQQKTIESLTRKMLKQQQINKEMKREIAELKKQRSK